MVDSTMGRKLEMHTNLRRMSKTSGSGCWIPTTLEFGLKNLRAPSKGLDYGELINDFENLLEDPIGVFCTSKELMPIVDRPY